jgi:hypothetical protein
MAGNANAAKPQVENFRNVQTPTAATGMNSENGSLTAFVKLF